MKSGVQKFGIKNKKDFQVSKIANVERCVNHGALDFRLVRLDAVKFGALNYTKQFKSICPDQGWYDCKEFFFVH